MLRLIIVMFGEVLKFLFIWLVILICLTSVASLLFGELEQYSKFKDVFTIMFQTGVGEFDVSPFQELSFDAVFGEVFIYSVVIINCIVLVNFIIAILAATYGKLSDYSLGIYYDGIIARIPVYEDDKKYGSLIVTSPPFNVFAIILVPIFFCLRDERMIININDFFAKLCFMPLALILTVIFMVMNLFMLPFAYLMAIFWKCKLLITKQSKSKKQSTSPSDISENVLKQKSRSTETIAIDVFVFTIFGLPMLLISQITDALYFLQHIYRTDVKEYGHQTYKELILTEE